MGATYIYDSADLKRTPVKTVYDMRWFESGASTKPRHSCCISPLPVWMLRKFFEDGLVRMVSNIEPLDGYVSPL